jgi:hypothetical protein
MGAHLVPRKDDVVEQSVQLVVVGHGDAQMVGRDTTLLAAERRRDPSALDHLAA